MSFHAPDQDPDETRPGEAAGAFEEAGDEPREEASSDAWMDESPNQESEDQESEDQESEDQESEDQESAEDLGDGLSLDDLGAAYARAAAQHDPEAFAPAGESETEQAEDDPDGDSAESREAMPDEQAEDDLVTPEAIIEGALFVGHPENQSLTEQRLASLIRDFTAEEVVEAIDRLNDSYREADQGIRIIRQDHGYRMTIAPEVEIVRRSFLGKVREARLSQAAIEVLALVAYQPGISAQKVQDQRGRESGALLNQLVRRQLLSMERVKPEDGGRKVPHYYPTERFLVLFGIDSLEDLPQVEEGLRET